MTENGRPVIGFESEVPYYARTIWNARAVGCLFKLHTINVACRSKIFEFPPADQEKILFAGVSGNQQMMRKQLEAAENLAGQIEDAESRKLLLDDLAKIEIPK